MPDPVQLRVARMAIGLSAEQLAHRAGVGLATLRRLERGGGAGVSRKLAGRVRRALEAEGARFPPPLPDGSLEVRWRTRA